MCNIVSQNTEANITTKELIVLNKEVIIENVSISPYYLKLINSHKKTIDSTNYTVDFSKARILFKDNSFNNQKIIVKYKSLPFFLTKTYKIFDESLIVDNSKTKKIKFYELDTSNEIGKEKNIFSGLETTGFLSRGITMGNNQDGVVNSGFKLQLKGKLSRKVNINATISDNTIPLQDNGYSQRLNEYDRVYVELYSDKWKLIGGDLFLTNENSRYLNFNKKVAGLNIETNLKTKKAKIDISASGAIVKGKYTEVRFNGQESNQGPYRLANNANQFLLIISDSETVYVNGISINKDNYILDYSSAEITFNTIFPINSDMRIVVEFQASEENYTRFVSYNKAAYKRDNFNVAVDFYTENDSKSKSLQQDLNDMQKQTLSNAGDNTSQMYVLSAVKENFLDNKIQYKKEIINGFDAFIYSDNPNDELYGVKFTYLGNNQGDYIIENTIATGKIYKFVSEINGVKQGDYEPKIQIVAPDKLQITSFKANFDNSKSKIFTELAFSNKDNNLFSSVDDDDNQGFAGDLLWSQLWIDKKWKLKSKLSYEYVDNTFTTIENIEEIEFWRDWNIENSNSNQSLLKTSLNYSNDKQGVINYQLEKLTFSDLFKGNKHSLHSNLIFNKTNLFVDASLMNSKSNIESSNFSQLHTDIKRQFLNFLVGFKTDIESNLRKNNNQKLTELSFKNNSYSTYFTIKDSIRTKLELGYSYKTNDSVQGFEFQNVNKSNNYYLKSDILKKKKVDLSVFLNYRHFTNSFFNKDESLNSKINYRQQLADNLFQFKTVYETSSGTIPQQEFNYLEVDSGKGYYAWIDYNNDGIQDLDEFEIAKFQDEALYIRVLLPSTKFIRTNQTKFSNLLTINPSKWSSSKTSLKKTISHFINQTTVSIDNKQLKTSNFQFNSFDTSNALALQFNFKNYLFYNRGKQHYSTTYSYLKSDNKTVFVTGLQENNLTSNQLQFSHKIHKTWLIDLKGIYSKTISKNERYTSRNMNLETKSFKGKLSYLFNDNQSSMDLSYSKNIKNNNSVNNETLNSNDYGVSLQHISSKKFSFTSSFNYIVNSYNGNQNSPIAYQLLEGLQKGENYTWNLILQKRITNYLSVDLNYNGRKSKKLKTIHIGTIQVRANF